MTTTQNTTFGQRRSAAFNRAFGRHKGLIALCCLLAFLGAVLSFDPFKPVLPVLQVLAYAAQAYLLYEVHRTTLRDAGARARPSLIDAIKFAALSAAIFGSAIGIVSLLQYALFSETPIIPGSRLFVLAFLTSWGPFLVIYLIVFPIIAMCFPSLAYDGRLRLAENVRAGLRIWPKVLGRIIVAILPWIVVGIIAVFAMQTVMGNSLSKAFPALFAGEFTPILIWLGVMAVVMTLLSIAALIGVAVTLSETFRDHGPIAGDGA